MEKYKARGAAAGGDYQASVRTAGQDWQANTAASADSWSQGVQEAIGRGAFVKGVNAAGGSHYQDRASTIGAQRFPQGIQAGAGLWAEGVQPYLDTLKGVNLPPRGPKGDPRNMQRAQAVAEAMRAKKLSR